MNTHRRLFCILWGFAHLFHYEWGYLLIREVPQTELVLAVIVSLLAACLIMFSKVKVLLFLLAFAQVIEVLYLSPHVPNHWLLATLINLTIIISLFKRKKRYQFFLGSAQLSVVIFYFFTFFWKLNTGFIMPEISCANLFMGHIVDKYGLALPRTAVVVPYLVLIVEAMLPVLLFIKRTRVWGVFLALSFHYFLALDSYKIFLNFSSVMFALVFLFLPFKEEQDENRRYFIYRIFALSLLFNIVIFISDHKFIETWFYARQGIWMLLGIYIVVSIAWHLRGREVVIYTNKTTLAFLVPLLVLLNGLTPVIGLKTGSAWQMYSNLSINQASSNHYFVPRSLDLFDLIRNPEKQADNLFFRKMSRILPNNQGKCQW